MVNFLSNSSAFSKNGAHRKDAENAEAIFLFSVERDGKQKEASLG